MEIQIHDGYDDIDESLSRYIKKIKTAAVRLISEKWGGGGGK